MIKQSSRWDLALGYLAQGLNIGAGILLLPIIVRYLPTADVGLWFVFITLTSLAQLLELGFQPTIARNVAYLVSGAKRLTKRGVPHGQIEEQPNYCALRNLTLAARRIYARVAAMATVALIGGGTLYINTLLEPEQSRIVCLGAWCAYAAGNILTLYFGYFNGLLQGRGDISQFNKVVIVTRASLILLGSISVALGAGLWGLGVSALVSSVLGRISAAMYFKRFAIPEARELSKIRIQRQVNAMTKLLWHNASKFGIVQVGAFLIQRGNILIASSFLGLSVSASYGLTLTVMMAVSSLAMVICQVQVPYMNSLQLTNDKETLAKVFSKVNVMVLLFFIFGTSVILILGNEILSIIGSKTFFLATGYLVALQIILLLEVNHGVSASYLMTKNEIPFVPAAIISGIAITALCLIFVSRGGVAALIASQGLVQLAYNNWKWPKVACKDLEISFLDVVRSGMKQMWVAKKS